jgi:phosphodiesterase/alkaline phosphatase D-like protein
MGVEQMSALKKWLDSFEPTDRRPKFILAGCVFGFALTSEVEFPALVLRADHWGGFPRSCRELVAALLDSRAENVVIVGGDFHLSAVARIELRRTGVGRMKTIHSIVASGLNSTIPFANVKISELPSGQIRLPFSDDSVEAVSSICPLSSAYRQFTRLDIRSEDPKGDWLIDIGVYDDLGKRVASKRIELRAADGNDQGIES